MVQDCLHTSPIETNHWHLCDHTHKSTGATAILVGWRRYLNMMHLCVQLENIGSVPVAGAPPGGPPTDIVMIST